MSLYQQLAEKLQFISPNLYKKRYFKNLKNLSKENYFEKNIEPELIWIKEFLPENSVFIDIGTNVGAYLYQLENKLRPENIIAFEPNNKLSTRLKRIYKNIRIYNVALSDTTEITELKIPIIKGKKLNSRGTLLLNFKENEEENHFLEKVKVMKLDDWVKSENLQKLDFIKIDVEGNEMKTLYGAKSTIAKFRPMLMVEIEQRHHETPVQQLIAEIENWNYFSYFLNRSTFELEKMTEKIILEQEKNFATNKKIYINNIIFLPKKLQE